MLIDAHTHVTFQDFRDETAAVVKRALENDIWLINASTHLGNSLTAVALAESYDQGVYAAIGLHPEHTYSHRVNEEGQIFKTRAENFDYQEFKKLAQSPKVVAIGECGLDYYWFNEDDDYVAIKNKQRQIFLEQIRLAIETDKALMVHCRPTTNTDDAYDDIYHILSETLKQHTKLRFQVHCFTGSLLAAEKLVNLGGYISCSGIITFDKTGRSEEVVKNIPLDKLLIETDAPYLSPIPYRGKRNEPSYVRYVAEKIAEWKQESFEAVAEATTFNAKKLFRI